MEMVPEHTSHYRFKISRALHLEFGGATVSVWNIIHMSRLTTPIAVQGLMTKEHYPQPLQASLDNTEEATGEKVFWTRSYGYSHFEKASRHYA